MTARIIDIMNSTAYKKELKDCEQASINADNQLHKENIGLRQSIIQNTPLKPMPTKMGTLDSNTLQLQKRALGATQVQAFIWLDTRRRRTSVSELLGPDENPHPETVRTARARVLQKRGKLRRRSFIEHSRRGKKTSEPRQQNGDC